MTEYFSDEPQDDQYGPATSQEWGEQMEAEIRPLPLATAVYEHLAERDLKPCPNLCLLCKEWESVRVSYDSLAREQF